MMKRYKIENENRGLNNNLRKDNADNISKNKREILQQKQADKAMILQEKKKIQEEIKAAQQEAFLEK